ncbi:surface protein PspC [Clostridium saccharobutylicum]|uniref:Surface protein PspC n=1 Tax=Clostridium saccharobutylicum DSM 13864 TaxID=1345695 RepID=U5MUL7_CLOSA|nr:surface protein PspC [Clostridium saccharobutylicum]AGX44228.1 surface protein PspC [Clostridium saccharobutylicum DSM 13864]AQR91517.1 autolysin [Clostridium saccharobutylicum]AQS01422.1 autolysin [Clostridium saccharobutylicum]AQS15405.1 autolysin [Clostridium saccharobutylicum]MBA2906175.1 hypothetical protein [Clostridium saccharobutylicum]
MKNFKKLIASFVTLITFLAITPVAAHAEWRQSGNSWWYAEGSSYATGWTQIDAQWYYFDSNGYMKTGWLCDGGNWYYFYGDGTMAHDCYIGNYYLNSAGSWTTSVPSTSGSSSSNYSTYGTSSTNDQSQTVYVSNNGIYHSSPHAHGMKYYTAMSLTEAKEKGYKACKKC